MNFLTSSLCASIKMATDVIITPNSTPPRANEPPKITSKPTTDDTSLFNQSNPTPPAETTTKTETTKIIDRCRPKNQNLTHPQQHPWYNPVCTEKDTRLTTAQRLLQHYRDNNRANTWYNPVRTEKETIKQQEQQQNQHNYDYLTYEQVKEQEEQQQQEVRD